MCTAFDQVVNISQWLSANAADFSPPVCNKMLFLDGTLQVMFVGGPNQRADYHINQGEEIFYQLKGDMCVRIMECGTSKDVHIREGEFFLLPAAIPHSPQRYENTMGLVLERARRPGELDGLRYYCDLSNSAILWERWFTCKDLGSELKPLIAEYFASEEHVTRKPTSQIPPAPMPIDTETMVKAPFRLAPCFDAIAPGDWPKELAHQEFVTLLVTSESSAPTLPLDTNCWVWTWEGAFVINQQHTLRAGECVAVKTLTHWSVAASTGAAAEPLTRSKALIVYTSVSFDPSSPVAGASPQSS